MGAYYGRILRDCSNDIIYAGAGESQCYNENEPHQTLAIFDGNTAHRLSLHDSRNASCISSVSSTFGEHISKTGFLKMFEEESECQDITNIYDDSKVAKAVSALQQSRLARTNTIAVCQNQHPVRIPWTLETSGSKLIYLDLKPAAKVI